VEDALLDRAVVALRDILAVAPGERVAIVDDGSLSRRMVEAFGSACAALDVHGAATVRYRPRRPISMKEYGLFGRASLYESSDLVPEPVLAAIAASDAVVFLTSDMEMVFDRGYVELVAERSRRIAWVAYIDEDSFLRLMAPDAADADRVHALTASVGERLRGAREIHIRSAAGTDLRMEIGDHSINIGSWYGAEGRGTPGVMFWPGGQVATVPREGTARGRLVVDRSVGAPEYRQLVEPIAFDVADGYVTSVDPGQEGRLMSQFLRGLGHREAYHLTELGFGTNPACRQTGIAAPAEDTHTLGCVSVALGADVHIGGETPGPCHIDMTMYGVTLTADGEELVRDGELLVTPAA